MTMIGGNNHGAIEIHYSDQGSGEPIVLIGGITSVLKVWDLMVPALDPAARRRTLEYRIHPDSLLKCPANLDFFIDTRKRYPHSTEELGRRARGIQALDTLSGLESLEVPRS